MSAGHKERTIELERKKLKKPVKLLTGERIWKGKRKKTPKEKGDR